MADPPKSLAEMTGTPKRVLVFLCYASDYTMQMACESYRKYLTDPSKCDPIELVEPKTPQGRPALNPTPEQVRAFLATKDLPANVPVIVSSHGMRKREWDAAGDLKADRLALATPTDAIDTEEVMKAIHQSMEHPSVWLNACHAGMACTPNFCLGGACGADESVTMHSQLGYMNQPTLDVLEILCKKDKFDRADGMNDTGTRDGKVTGAELTRYFCEAKQYRPFHDIYVRARKLNDLRTKWVDVPKDEQETQIAREKQLLKRQIQEDLNEDLPGLEATLRQWKAQVKRNRQQAPEFERELEKLNPKLEAARAAMKAARDLESPEGRRLVDAFNLLATNHNILVHNSQLGDTNQKQVDDLEARIRRLGYLKKIYGNDVDALMAAIEWIPNPSESRTVSASDNRPVDYLLRGHFPNPDKKTACVWAGRDSFAHPQLSHLELYYAPRPKSPAGPAPRKPAEKGPQSPAHNGDGAKSRPETRE